MQIYNNYTFEHPIYVIEAFDNNTFIDALKRIDKLKNKYYLLGYIRYEAYKIFQCRNISSKNPILYFEVYDNHKKITFKESNINPNIHIEEILEEKKYKKNILKIKELIENGITYEVNYTYPLNIYTDCSEFKLYTYLLKKQKTPYNMFFKNKYETILSFSPELFFRIKNNKICTKPMKGTVKRGISLIEDLDNYYFLKNDEKNRSENIMIVDLIRNDLSKISKTGSIKVEKLFEIEKHKTLFQMTSEITSELKSNISLYQILDALFPCGSITGAPKISTMKVIEEIEKEQREIYCGAIGFLSPDETIFSVPIRILQKKNNEIAYKYFSGGAIVWDSNEEEEWQETITKRKFLDSNTNFQLIETMKVQNSKIILKEEHFARLKKSCSFFNFKYPIEIEEYKPIKDGMLRLLVNKDGSYFIEYKEINDEIKTNKIAISKNKVYSRNIFLQHKTTIRKHYKETGEKIKRNEVFDEIYLNEKDEITEGSRSNIVIKQNGILYTPPIKCGLLNGTYRSKLIKENKIKEKILYIKDLRNAEEIYCINSVRGMVKVEINDNN